MSKIGIWSIEGESPKRLEDFSGHLEKNLEDWIKADPSLVMDGLRWVRRQGTLADRSRLDLLGITATGDWIVAELKAKTVGIATLMQALHYATNFGTMTAEEVTKLMDVSASPDDSQIRQALESLEAAPRPIEIFLIGTERDPRLDQGIAFLVGQGLQIPVRVVTFQLFKDLSGKVLMARHVERSQNPTEPTAGQTTLSLGAIVEKADAVGVGALMRRFLELAERENLHPRPWGASITLNSPKDRRRSAIYLAPHQSRTLQFTYMPEQLSDILSVPDIEVREALGAHSFEQADADVTEFLKRLETLFATSKLSASLRE